MSTQPVHMLSAFDLRPGQTLDEFRTLYAAFIAELTAASLIEAAGPLGQRVSDTPMDTDTERDHQLFSILTFRDRARMDAAYAHIEAKRQTATAEHRDMYACTANAIFTCWQDVP